MPTARSVLVIEDDTSMSLYMQQLLSSWGVQVFLANDGLTGLAMVREYRPAVVITDLDMPVQDGWKTIQQIKADPQTRGIQVLALTGKSTSWDRDAAYDAGVDHFLVKPADSRLLRSLIDRCLQ